MDWRRRMHMLQKPAKFVELPQMMTFLLAFGTPNDSLVFQTGASFSLPEVSSQITLLFGAFLPHMGCDSANVSG